MRGSSMPGFVYVLSVPVPGSYPTTVGPLAPRIHANGPCGATVGQGDLIPALGVIVAPVRAGGREGGGGDLVHLHARRWVAIRAPGRDGRDVEDIVGRGERRLQGRRDGQEGGIRRAAAARRGDGDRGAGTLALAGGGNRGAAHCHGGH